MTKVILANDIARIETSDGGVHREYGGNFPGRVFDVDDSMAKLIVKAGGFKASLAGTSSAGIGYRCACGFAPYFSPCSRCGEEVPHG